jgi:hypothetical protein
VLVAGTVALLGAMTSVVAAWGGLFLVIVGLGLSSRRALGSLVDTAPAGLADFWIGWAVLVALLQFWHLGLPVDERALAAVAILATVGWLSHARECGSFWPASPSRPSWRFWLALLLAATVLANRAVGPPLNIDSGRYHFESVRWVASYPIVPGLGNLRRQLSLNSSYFLYAAMLDVGWWQRRAQHLANGLFLLALFGQILLSARALLAARMRADPIDVFWLLLLAPVVGAALGSNVASPSPDLPIFALGMVIASELLFLLVHPEARPDRRAHAFLGIVLMACVGLTVKLSIAAFGAAAVIVAFVAWRGVAGQAPAGRTTLVAAIAAALIVGAWMIRGIVISGYPAYPIGVGAAPVEWRLPASVLEDSRASIHDLARLPILADMPAKDRRAWFSTWDWLRPWMRRLRLYRAEVVMPCLAALAACVVALCCRWRHPQPRPAGARRASFFVVPAVALACWFLTAPDPRFAFASFAIVAPATFALVFERHVSARLGIVRAGAAVACGLAAVLLATSFAWIPAGPDGGFHPPPIMPLRPFMTRSGLTLHVPPRDKCWDGPLTCTTSPQAGLRLRRGNDLRSGFVVDQGD